MTHKERVLAAINHREPDRVPIVIGISNATGIKMKTYQGVKKLIGVNAPNQYLYDWPELGTAAVDEQTLERLHGDVRCVLDLEPLSIRQRNETRGPQDAYINSWGTSQYQLSEGDW
ncbi:MAG: hypothetical protein H0S82_07040, partial [Anaerolineaceae bacterium]|nr:hypothetical protein [Anaerolineaceae bacterium]